MSAQLFNKAAKTAYGSRVDADLIVSNTKIDKFFVDDFEIRSIKVYAYFSEPIFRLPVQVEVFEVKKLEPGYKEVVRITSNYGGLKLEKVSFYPRKAYKKGTVMDSKVFDL